MCLKGKVWRESGTVLLAKEIDKRGIVKYEVEINKKVKFFVFVYW